MKSKEDIQKYIVDVLKDKLNVLISSPNVKDISNLNFFGNGISISHRDMVYLFYLLEKKYNVKFTENDIDNSLFYTIGGIRDIIASKILVVE